MMQLRIVGWRESFDIYIRDDWWNAGPSNQTNHQTSRLKVGNQRIARFSPWEHRWNGSLHQLKSVEGDVPNKIEFPDTCLSGWGSLDLWLGMPLHLLPLGGRFREQERGGGRLINLLFQIAVPLKKLTLLLAILFSVQTHSRLQEFISLPQIILFNFAKKYVIRLSYVILPLPHITFSNG